MKRHNIEPLPSVCYNQHLADKNHGYYPEKTAAVTKMECRPACGKSAGVK